MEITNRPNSHIFKKSFARHNIFISFFETYTAPTTIPTTIETKLNLFKSQFNLIDKLLANITLTNVQRGD